MIKPTVARMVWFWPNGYIPNSDGNGQPWAGTVAHVHNNTMVNLSVIDPDGERSGRSSVPLLQEEGESSEFPCCTWMPYQKGQAAKTEAAEARQESVAPVSARPSRNVQAATEEGIIVASIQEYEYSTKHIRVHGYAMSESAVLTSHILGASYTNLEFTDWERAKAWIEDYASRLSLGLL